MDEWTFGDYEPGAVLTNGVPTRSVALEPGEVFRLATWQDDSHGAVLYASRSRPDEIGNWHTEHEARAVLLDRHDNKWQADGGGGCSWEDPWSFSAQQRERMYLLRAGASGQRLADGGWIIVVGGLCSPTVCWVEVIGARRDRYLINSPLHAFVVGIYGETESTLRLLDANEEVVRHSDGIPCELAVGPDHPRGPSHTWPRGRYW